MLTFMFTSVTSRFSCLQRSGCILSSSMKVLELFSGIGGMHFAFRESGFPGEVVAAVDINTVANNVYRSNFKSTTLLQNNIQSLTADFINKLDPEMILMSPPCQPFTRVGLKKDIEDRRTDALLHFLSILPELSQKLSYILLENVKGFETSDSCAELLKVLSENGFSYQQFLLSPVQFNIPNSRERYYLVSRRKPFVSNVEQVIMNSITEELLKSYETLSNQIHPVTRIKDILEFSDSKDELYQHYLVSDKILKKRVWVFDIVTKESERSCCFTKAYSHYAEGTGSIYCPLDQIEMDNIFRELKDTSPESQDYENNLKKLKLRYFTPKEVSRLMCFPEDFHFPDSVTDKQKYRLLGNSINVKVVAVLIKLLCSSELS